jgi:hypothetical protein
MRAGQLGQVESCQVEYSETRGAWMQVESYVDI